jgi:hypothetical protein
LASPPQRRIAADTVDLIAANDRGRIADSDNRSSRRLEKRPLALRKHPRRPSPSDDDGTSPDPTDDDETSDDVIDDNSTEMAIAIWSPAPVSLRITSEQGLHPFRCASPTPLFLALQRFRC